MIFSVLPSYTRPNQGTAVGSYRSRFLTVCLSTALGCALWTAPAYAETPTIGISVRSWDKGRFTDLLTPVITRAAEAAGYRIILVNAEDSVEKQADDIANLVEQGVAGVVVGLVNCDAGPIVGAAAAENGVPLVYMNVSPINLTQLPPRQAYVGPDEYGVGRAQALAVCEALEDGGVVGLLIGDLLHPAAAARSKAVQQTIRSDQCDGVDLVYEETAQWNREFAMDVTLDWLDQSQGLDAIIANNDPMGLGAVDALQSVGIGMETVFVTSVDGQPEAMESVRAGGLDLTFLQDVDQQGQAIFTTLERIVDGSPFESVVLLPLTDIRAESLDSRVDG